MHYGRHLLGNPETLLYSLGAAVLFAVTWVLQHTAAAEVESKHSLRPRLILELLRRPRWLLGNLTDLAAFGLQFLALRSGSLVAVQTLLVSALLFTLPMAAAVANRRLQLKEWLSAVALVLSLSTFLILANPTRGRPRAPWEIWILVLAVAGAAIGALIFTAPSTPGRARARRLGASCGILFAVNAALAKQFTHVLKGGVLPALTSWEPYAWAVTAGFGFLLVQSALHAGPLDASMPLLIIADPLVAGVIGIVAFHERIVVRPVTAAVEVLSIVIVILSVFALVRSPLVADPQRS